MAANESRMRGDMNEGSTTPTNQSYANPAKERSSETHGCENSSQGVSIGCCSPYWRYADDQIHPRSRSHSETSRAADPSTSSRDSTVWASRADAHRAVGTDVQRERCEPQPAPCRHNDAPRSVQKAS